MMEALRLVLESHDVPRLTLATATPAALEASLTAHGMALVALPDLDVRGLQEQAGELLAATFPGLPEEVRADLHDGKYESFNKTWRTSKVAHHGILLKSAGMPIPPMIDRRVRLSYMDPSTGGVFRKYPLAAQAPQLVWQAVPLLPAGAYVAGDGIKTMPGTVATPLHCDRNGPDKVQAILLGDGPRAKRHLYAIPTTERILGMIQEILGLEKLPDVGFVTFGLDKHAPLAALLRKHAVTAQGLLFLRGALHCEKANPLATRKGRTFRMYCGYVVDAARTIPSVEKRVRLAYYRQHGYELDPFSRVQNRAAFPVCFANAKSSQYKAVRETQCDRRLVNLFNVPVSCMKQTLLENGTYAEYGLRAEDLANPNKRQKRTVEPEGDDEESDSDSLSDSEDEDLLCNILK